MWKSTFRQNYRTVLTHRVPSFAVRGLSCCIDVGGHLAAEAGTSKLGGDPGLQNKPLGCGSSEVYASGMPRALLAKKKKKKKIRFYIFSLRNFLRNHVCWHHSTRPGVHESEVTEFCLVAPNMYGCSVWNLLYVIPVPRILRWLLNFLKTLAPLPWALMLICWFLWSQQRDGHTAWTF